MLWVCVMLSQSNGQINLSICSGCCSDTEVDVFDCYSLDLMLLFWTPHCKSSQKAIFPFISLNLTLLLNSLTVISFTLTLPHIFSGSQSWCKTSNAVRKEQQPSLTSLFNGTELALLLPPVLIFFKLWERPSTSARVSLIAGWWEMNGTLLGSAVNQ